MSVCRTHSQVRALFCEEDLEVLLPLSSSPDHQGHHMKSRLSNSPQPPTRLSRERSRWKTRDRKHFLNFSMGSSLQNVSKRRVKGGGIHPPEVCCCPGGAIIFSWGPLKNSRCRERLSQREAFSELPLLAKWN